VEDEVGDGRLLERRREPLHELVREAANEADGVRDEVATPVVREGARRRIERLEEAVVDRGARVRERVQKRRLSGVRVPRERDHRRLTRPTRLALGVAPALELLELAAKDADPSPREPTVRLELRLAGSACPDSAPEPLEMLPEAAHAREVVLELGELDLQLPLGRDGMLGEDVEDELRPVDDPQVQQVLEAPLLTRGELVVDDERLGATRGNGTLQLLELALADVRPGVGRSAPLHDLADGLDARRDEKRPELLQLHVLVDARPQHGNEEPALGLGPRRGIRLMLSHELIMPAP
jgi:hypothetical protein